jgi:hypothetical protein
MLYDLFHEGTLEVGGRTLYLDRPALPVPVKESDSIRWVFKEPIGIETPGPNSKLREVRQYRDRVEFTIWPWADVTVRIEE